MPPKETVEFDNLSLAIEPANWELVIVPVRLVVAKLPSKVVAVRIPTPKIFLLLPFKSPPSLGVVSPRIVVVIPVSEVNG